MNNNGMLTYSNIDPLLVSWSMENRVLNTLVTALLGTIIALQGKALLFDLILGFKRKGVMKIHDMHIFLLSGESSPLAVLDAIFRSDWITRKRLRGDVPRGTKIDRDPRRIRLVVYVRLLLLLMIGPALQITAISLSLEADRTYSFKEAGFSGLKFGIDFESQVSLEVESLSCSAVKVDYGKTDSALASFHRCSDLTLDKDFEDNINPGEALLVVAIFSTGSFILRVSNETHGVSKEYWGEIRHSGKILRVKPEASFEELHAVAAIGLARLQSICSSTISSNQTRDEYEPRFLFVKYTLPCASLPTEDQHDVVQNMSVTLTYKSAEELEVVDFLEIPFDSEQAVPYRSADDIPFITRTRGNMSPAVLFIAAAAAVVLRILIRLFVAYNDFPVAAEVIIKNCFHLRACDSLLQDDTVVPYRRKFQLVDEGHFGITSRDGLPEVECFEGGVVR